MSSASEAEDAEVSADSVEVMDESMYWEVKVDVVIVVVRTAAVLPLVASEDEVELKDRLEEEETEGSGFETSLALR